MIDVVEIQWNILFHRMIHIATIGIGTMAGPGILFIIPFVLPLDQFADFAAVLAIAQLIMVIGGFSLDVSCPRLAIGYKLAALYSLLSILVASAAVFIGFGSSLNQKFLIGSLIAWAGSLTAIIHAYSLFAGRAKLYGLIGVTKALLFLIVLMTSVYFGVSPAIAWFLAALSSLLVAFLLMILNNGFSMIGSKTLSSWKDVVHFSAPLAIIVAAGTLPFVIDRAIAQHMLSATDFARYAVAATWAVPIIYFGNIIYQSMIATKNKDSLRTLFSWGIVIFAVAMFYILFVGILSLYYVRVPYFDDGLDFIRLWGWIVGWYAIYSSISFPVAAVIQKHFVTDQLKSLAYFTVGVVTLYLISMVGLYAIFGAKVTSGDKTMAIISFTLLFAVLGVLPKVLTVIRYLLKY